jgi:hypothetical protein
MTLPEKLARVSIPFNGVHSASLPGDVSNASLLIADEVCFVSCFLF